MRTETLATSPVNHLCPQACGPPESTLLQGARVLANGMLTMPLVQLMISLLPLQCSTLPFSEAHRRLCNPLLEVRLVVPNVVEEKITVIRKLRIAPDFRGLPFVGKYIFP